MRGGAPAPPLLPLSLLSIFSLSVHRPLTIAPKSVAASSPQLPAKQLLQSTAVAGFHTLWGTVGGFIPAISAEFLTAAQILPVALEMAL